MELYQTFFLVLGAAFIGVVPPGLVNMSVAKTCVEKSKREAFFMAAGASLVVFFQALLAVQMARFILRNPYWHNMLLRTAVVILLILALYFFFSAQKSDTIIKDFKKSSGKSFFKGILVSVLNVLPIPYFVILSSLIAPKGEMDFTKTTVFWFSIAAGTGTFIALYLYIFSADKIFDKSVKFKKYSNYVLSGLMFLLVIITLIRVYYG
ncbi:MAG: LysE family translocator [Bacteroidota bacterium]